MRQVTLIALAVAAVAGAFANAQGTWSPPVEVAALNSTTQDYYPHISPDGLRLRIASSRTDIPGFVGGWDINFVTRLGSGQNWSALQNEPGINTVGNDLSQHFLSNDLVVYWAVNLTGGTGGHDIYRADRAATNLPWGNRTEITAVNTTGTEYGVSVTDDELYMLLSSGGNVRESTRATTSQPWSTPVVVAPFNIGTGYGPWVSPEGLTCYFAASNGGSVNLFHSSRPFRTSPWSTPVQVPNVNAAATDRAPSVTGNGRELYFSSSRTGGTGGQDVYTSNFTGLSFQGLPQVGSQVLLHVTNAAMPLANYQVGLSFSNNAGILIPGVGTVPLDFDNLLILTVATPVPSLVQKFSGTLNARGEATGTVFIPPIAGLIGLPFHAAAVVIGSPSYITNGLVLGIHR